MTKTATVLIMAACFTLPTLALGTSSCPTADSNCTNSCTSNGSSNTICSSSTDASTCDSNCGTSTCSSGTSGSSCAASGSSSSDAAEGESVERSEAADKALLDTTTGNLEQSRKLLDMSSNLLHASKEIVSMEGLNSVYIDAMLHLADDIAVMSERTAKSADKVIVMDEQNEGDLQRTVTASDMILRNNTKIQQNLLESQQNFNDTLTILNQ